MALPATDNFNRGAQTTLGANWTDQVGGWKTNASDQCVPQTSDMNFSLWNADSFNADQYSEFAAIDGAQLCPSVRASDVGSGAYNAYGGFLYTESLTGRVSKFIDGSETQLQNGFNPIGVGTVVRLEAEGTSVRLYYDTVQQGTTMTDAALGSGSAGLSGFSSAVALDNWEGGNLSAAVSAALTGTALAGITEADVVAGSKTIIITLTGDTFIPS